MVHYDKDPRNAAQPTPPTCPKCGNHRTEVIDRADDGRTVTVRCNTCGARSTVLIDRRATDADTVTDEIEAIRTVGRALAQLPDTQTRERVLRWAVERFRIDATIGVAVPAAAATVLPHAARTQSADPTLSMDGVQEFFGSAPRVEKTLDVDDEVDFDEVPSVVHAEALAQAEPTMQTEVAALSPAAMRLQPAMPVESMVHSFVADFQRLVSDLDTVFAAPVPSSR